MEKRKLEELNLLDDFLFGTMVNYPEIGEKFVRELLKVIFNKEFGSLKVVPQKIYPGVDTDMHGARLDVFIEEDEADEVTVYDLEPDKNVKDVLTLPKRNRFYHAMIDARSLKSGESYEKLKQVIVIFVTPYDPFEQNHMVYTIKNGCKEIPDMPYDDGASTIFLYTKGIKGDPPEELKQLLRYMEKTTEENATTENLRNIQKMVDCVKHDKGVSLQYMKIFEREEMLIREGKVQGNIEGCKENIIELLEDLGEISEELRCKIMNENDLQILKRWLKLSARAESLEDFQNKM